MGGLEGAHFITLLARLSEHVVQCIRVVLKIGFATVSNVHA